MPLPAPVTIATLVVMLADSAKRRVPHSTSLTPSSRSLRSPRSSGAEAPEAVAIRAPSAHRHAPWRVVGAVIGRRIVVWVRGVIGWRGPRIARWHYRNAVGRRRGRRREPGRLLRELPFAPLKQAHGFVGCDLAARDASIGLAAINFHLALHLLRLCRREGRWRRCAVLRKRRMAHCRQRCRRDRHCPAFHRTSPVPIGAAIINSDRIRRLPSSIPKNVVRFAQ